MHFFCIFLLKYLVMSKKSSTFAPAFEKQSNDLYRLTNSHTASSWGPQRKPAKRL